MNVLAPLVVPKRLVHRGGKKTDKSEGEGEGEVEGGQLNQTDQEKGVAKDTANLLEVPPTYFASGLILVVGCSF